MYVSRGQIWLGHIRYSLFITLPWRLLTCQWILNKLYETVSLAVLAVLPVEFAVLAVELAVLVVVLVLLYY